MRVRKKPTMVRDFGWYSLAVFMLVLSYTGVRPVAAATTALTGEVGAGIELLGANDEGESGHAWRTSPDATTWEQLDGRLTLRKPPS